MRFLRKKPRIQHLPDDNEQSASLLKHSSVSHASAMKNFEPSDKPVLPEAPTYREARYTSQLRLTSLNSD